MTLKLHKILPVLISAVFSGGAGGARAPPEFGGSEKGRSLISAYRSLAITTNTPGFKKLSTALNADPLWNFEMLRNESPHQNQLQKPKICRMWDI